MALYWSLLKVIKNDIISIEGCWYIVDHLVFSTYVEVILNFTIDRKRMDCILHVCGGDPVRV